MDKETLSQYGWVTICIIIVVILIALATPFGNYIYAQAENAVVSLGNKVKDTFANANINYDTPAFGESSENVPGSMSGGGSANQQGGNNTPTTPNTAYTLDQINADDHLFAIGATKPEYVVAKFNDDYTELTIMPNGESSDGLIVDFMDSINAYTDTKPTETIDDYVREQTVGSPYDPNSFSVTTSYLADGFANALMVVINNVLAEGTSLGKVDSDGNPVDDEAMQWLADRASELSNGVIDLTQSNMINPNVTDRDIAIFVFNQSNGMVSYYNEQPISGNTVDGRFSASMNAYANYFESKGCITPPSWRHQETLKTVNISDGIVNLPANMLSYAGYENDPITVNIPGSVTDIDTNAANHSIVNVVNV